MYLGDFKKSGELNKGKVWFDRQDSTLTFGITNSAIEEIGEIDGLEVSNEGDEFRRGDVIATIEGNRGRIEVVAPMDGTVEAVNEAARNEPGIVSEDPLEEGWLVKIQCEDSEKNPDDSDDEDEREVFEDE